MPYSFRSSGRPASRRSTTYSSSSRGPRRKNGKESINPARFIKPARETTLVDAYAPLHVFTDFAVHDLLQANIQAKGFTAPSPIQDQAVPEGLAGHDVVGIANTGTGKTIAFAIPVLDKLLTDRSARALILAPTRELAAQIEEECKALAKGSGLYGALLIGGASMGLQLKSLRERPSIIIGTPGRIKDHIERGSLNLSGFTSLVLDEVDRMLDMGFVNDIRWILSKMPPERQSFFFTATLDASINSLIQEFAHTPVTISVKTGETTDTVAQDIIRFNGKTERMERLHDLLLKAPKALVFDETQHSVERLSKELIARGFQADAIHGGKSQGQRQRALARFKGNEINVLVATDVAARGLDVSDITHVINYSTPRSYDDYIHRIGRAGRAGRTGYAFTFIEESSSRY
jgi:ATP-dependent RNA helicase RhlE